ncbi:MAG: S-layer homology domain-containing protein [Cyanobacteria bacterium J06659_2]
MDLDEFVAVVVALFAVGLILLWGLTRRAVVGNPLSLIDTEAVAGANVEEQTDQIELGASRVDGEAEAARSSDGVLSAWRVQIRGQSATNSGDSHFEALATRPDAVAASPSTLLSNGLDQTNADIDSPASKTDGESTADDETVVDPSVVDNLPNLPASSGQLIEPGPPIEFSDVPTNYWATNFIDALTGRQMMSGYNDGTFRPDVPVTRAELASQIEAVFRAQSRQNAIAFSDINADYWASGKIQSAVETGFMSGYPEGDFKPDQAVPRVQVFVALASGLGLDSPADADAIVSRYEDADAIPDWAISQIAAATQSGLVVNYPNRDQLQPERPATRAEVAAIMTRALVFTGQMEDQPSEYVVK